jgi:hypothetical protein
MVASNTTWTVQSDASWCAVTAAGTNNDTIDVVIGENLSVGVRVANITVNGAGAGSQTVTVTQEGATPILSVTPANQNVPATAGNTTFEVISNTTWTVISDAAWCSVTSSGSNNGTITATLQENISTSSRVSNVTVTAPGLASVTVTVTQAGAAPTLSVTPANQEVLAAAGSTAYTVTSNSNWIVTTGETWCTVTAAGSGNGTIVADFTVNTTDQPRIASLEVKVPGLTAQTVTVTQAKSGIGVNETAGNSILIFPNPTGGIFKIVPSPADRRAMDVTVQDVTGKVVFTKKCKGEKEYQFDISSSPQGTYHIIVKSDGGVVVSKVVVIK